MKKKDDLQVLKKENFINKVKSSITKLLEKLGVVSTVEVEEKKDIDNNTNNLSEINVAGKYNDIFNDLEVEIDKKKTNESKENNSEKNNTNKINIDEKYNDIFNDLEVEITEDEDKDKKVHQITKEENNSDTANTDKK